MKFKKILYSFLAGGSLALGGRWIYRHERVRREALRQRNQRMRRIIIESVTRLAKIYAEGISVQEVYFFIWIIERVCARHRIDFPGFGFKVKKGLLFSSLLTYILRRMIKEGTLKLEGEYLLPGENGSELPLDKTDRRVLKVIKETTAQWKSDFPEEPLVRFGQLFHQLRPHPDQS